MAVREKANAATTSPTTASGPSHPISPTQGGKTSDDLHGPLSADYSTIVTRVPNKSIEDLALDSRAPTEYLGAYGMGGVDHRQPCDVYSHPCCNQWDQLHSQAHSQDKGGGAKSSLGLVIDKPASQSSGGRSPKLLASKQPQQQQVNTFGLIKDLSVANIIASDADKTQSFTEKDFSQAFSKKILMPKPFMDQVFEPRPSAKATRGSSPLKYPGKAVKEQELESGRHPGPRSSHYLVEPFGDPWLKQTDADKGNCLSPSGITQAVAADRLGGSHGNLAHLLAPPPPPPTSLRRYSAPDSKADSTSPNSPSHLSPKQQHSSARSSSQSSFTPPLPKFHPSGHASRLVAPPPTSSESLENALQNLSDLTDRLQCHGNIDPDDIVIDSRVLESMLQGAEGYTPRSPSRDEMHHPRISSRETDLDSIGDTGPLLSDLDGVANQEDSGSRPLLVQSFRGVGQDEGEEQEEEEGRDAVFV